MKIAVVGAGYAGLAVAWHLLQKSKCQVTLFDSIGIGAGASGSSTGLLHPYPAKNVNKSHRADEAMLETAKLIDIAQSALGRPVALCRGILRLATTLTQEEAFARSDCEVLEEERVHSLLPHVLPVKGLWIPQGKTVFSRLYLEGLWLACQKQGAQLIKENISQLSQLDDYDRIVLANGHDVMRFEECSHLPLKARKGQALICRWPSGLEPLPFSLIGNGHLSLTEDPTLCQLGSTYEEEFDLTAAYGLRKKIGVFFPPALNFEVVEVRSGTRIAPKIGYLPLIEKINTKTSVFAGLGSRGLLYHALYAKELIESLLL